MFLDLAAPYSIRLHYLQSFLKLDGQNQHAVLRQWIALQFLAIYTKVRSTVTCLGLCTFLVLPSLPLASVVLFAKSDKDGYDKSNITVTYILFLGTVVMELAPFFFILIIGICLSPCNNLTNKLTHALRWQRHGCPAQHHVSLCSEEEAPNSDEACYLQLPQALVHLAQMCSPTNLGAGSSPHGRPWVEEVHT
jgi:hypothetical protein